MGYKVFFENVKTHKISMYTYRSYDDVERAMKYGTGATDEVYLTCVPESQWYKDSKRLTRVVVGY